MILTQEDITKNDEVLKYSTTKCFNYLSYIKDKRTRERNAMLKSQNKKKYTK